MREAPFFFCFSVKTILEVPQYRQIDLLKVPRTFASSATLSFPPWLFCSHIPPKLLPLQSPWRLLLAPSLASPPKPPQEAPAPPPSELQPPLTPDAPLPARRSSLHPVVATLPAQVAAPPPLRTYLESSVSPVLEVLTSTSTTEA